MLKVNTHEAKTRLSELLAAVEKRGEVVVLCRAGRPIAEIRRLPRRRDPLRKDPKLSRIVFREDPAAPVHPEDWPDSAR
ncbi:MAG TPA: type II toxin-antitoxin system prevent-host-death family antitoxin [Candidatus Binatia bacterium]|nr:type II toxin-antitoxin system prevent-host-death family antitoxin [Candidatus Binatia bacterium]